ncbi:MAG: hypothetical protein IT326_01835 [Anaerolineae bacterium]|nr:hypothetical protein [Anaerolineae bacterium]
MKLTTASPFFRPLCRVFRALDRLATLLGWTEHSYYLMSAFVVTCCLIALIWWPLYQEVLAYIRKTGLPWTVLIDWLLIGIWLAMSLLIMAGADLRKDVLIVFVGLCGGLVIESWGTQTELWVYYTAERPPLWIIPAWPVASLSIDRIVRFLDRRVERFEGRVVDVLYWAVFGAFMALMLVFVWPTITKSLTLAALLLCMLLIIRPMDKRMMLLTFAAGAGFGYFLELWGTTRLCWTYYTGEQPPLFAVLAHGMAAVAFWRSSLLVKLVLSWFRPAPQPMAAD